MKTRRGISLAELLLAMSACTVILTTSVALLHRIMLTESKTRGFFESERNSLRLSNQFRQDIHGAEEVIADRDKLDDGVLIRLQMANRQTISYQHRDGELLRTRSADEQVIQREQFKFSPDLQAEVKVADSPPTVTLSLLARPAQTSLTGNEPRLPAFATPLALQVSAVLGRDKRFASAVPGEESAP